MELNGAAIFHSIHYERYFKWTSQQFGQMKTTNDGLGGMKEEIKQWNSLIYFWYIVYSLSNFKITAFTRIAATK